MRALLIAGAATAVVVGLAGCGQDTGDDRTAEAPVTSRPSSAVAEPTPPEVTPTHPDTKLQDPPPSTGAGAGTPPASGAPDAPVTLSSDGPVVPAGVRQVPASQVDVSGVPEYYDHRGQVWVYDDGHALQMFAMASSGCSGVDARVTSESATEVRIVMGPLPQPQGGPPDGRLCTAVLTPRPATVALDAPLGDRMIYLSAGR